MPEGFLEQLMITPRGYFLDGESGWRNNGEPEKRKY